MNPGKTILPKKIWKSAEKNSSREIWAGCFSARAFKIVLGKI
jgi:hypothetical protein